MKAGLAELEHWIYEASEEVSKRATRVNLQMKSHGMTVVVNSFDARYILQLKD